MRTMANIDDHATTSLPRDLALQQVGYNARKNWSFLPEEWQTDKEFVLKALHESPTLPCKSDFERKFPQSLRFDKAVVLGFCQRDDFLELFESRHLFVPGCLTNDKEVMLAYCQKIPRSLQECSEELTDNDEIVYAAIKLGGLELQYASLRLQEDKATVIQACQSHGLALEFCPPGQTRQELVQNRHFMLNTVLSKPGGGPMWRLIPSNLRDNDSEMLLMALRHGLLLRDVPEQFMNEAFLQSAVKNNTSLYMELSRYSWQICPTLAKQAAVSSTATAEIIKKALENVPSISLDKTVILQVAERGSLECLEELVQKDDFRFFDDLDVMKAFIIRDTKFFSYASGRLKQVPEIIIVSITPESAWNTLKTLPLSLQRANPAIAIEAVRKSIPRNLRYLPSHIPEELWTSSRELGEAWIQRGGRIFEVLERKLRTDTRLALEVASHKWSEFYKVGDTLLRNRQFMLQALERDGRVIRFANSQLTKEFEILVVAVANHPTQEQQRQQNADQQQKISSISGTFANICNLEQLQEQIQSRLDLHSTFLLDFLRGIAVSPQPNVAPNVRSQLRMLDRGVETSQAFKALIGEYVGVPTRGKLKLLRQAMQKLKTQSSTTPRDDPQGPDHEEPFRFRRQMRERRLVHLRHRLDLRRNDVVERPAARNLRPADEHFNIRAFEVDDEGLPNPDDEEDRLFHQPPQALLNIGQQPRQQPRDDQGLDVFLNFM